MKNLPSISTLSAFKLSISTSDESPGDLGSGKFCGAGEALEGVEAVVSGVSEVAGGKVAGNVKEAAAMASF